MLFILLSCAVLIAAQRAGVGIGLLVTLLGCLIVGTPALTAIDGGYHRLYQVASFLLVGVTFSVLSESLRTQRQWMIESEIGSRRTNEQLAEVEERFRVVAENAPLYLWMTNKSGELSWLNRRWESLVSPERIKHWPSWVHPDDRHFWQALNAGPACRREPVQWEFRVRDAEDREHWLVTEATARYATSGEFQGYLGSAVDISEIKRVHEEQSRQRRFLETLVDKAPVGIAVVSIPEHRFVITNPIFRSFARDSESDFKEQTVQEIFPDAVAQGALKVVETVVATRQTMQVRDFEIRVGVDREPTFWNAELVPLSADQDCVESVLVLVVPVTEAVMARRRLEALKETAERSNRSMDRFLAILSHELRTPLMPVLAAAADLSEDPETTESMRSMLAMIQRNVELEARLIDDLLDMTRITQGKLTLNRERTDMHKVVQLAVEVCRSQIEASGITLQIHLGAAQSSVHGDSARLQQVLWNLFKNALKFTPSGGTLSIFTRNVESVRVGSGTSTTALLIEVSDTGSGLDPDSLERIFLPFEQGDSATPRKFGGLGLGLAISRSIIEAHQGRILARSAGPGTGSTFTIELEVAGAHVLPAVLPSPIVSRILQPQNSLSLRILLVEDDPDTLGVMSRLLARRGHIVQEAGSLAEGRRLAANSETPIDLLICDVGLPDGNGLDLIRELHERSRVPAIALSGFGREEDLDRSYAAGVIEHLIKPVGLLDLDNAIAKILKTARAGWN